MPKISLKNFITFSLTSDRRKATFVKSIFVGSGGPDFWGGFKQGLKHFFLDQETDIDLLQSYIKPTITQTNQQNAYEIGTHSFALFYKKYLKNKSVDHSDDPLTMYWHYNDLFISLGMSLALTVNGQKTYIKFLYETKKKFTKRDAQPYLEMIQSVYSSYKEPACIIVRLDTGQYYEYHTTDDKSTTQSYSYLHQQSETLLSIIKKY